MNQPLPVRLDDLIAHINDQHPDGDSLGQLSDAVLLAERLGEQADHLIGHFVDQARRSGASWTDIGKHMGVSKQAAQKRFVTKADESDPEFTESAMFGRFTDRARITVDKAQLAARNACSPEVSTVHLVLGLLEERNSLAGMALDQLHVDFDALTRDAKEKLPEPGEFTTGVIPFAGDGRTAMKLSVREALGLGHNYVGTEHLLLGVLATEGAGADIFAGHGVDKETTKDKIVAILTDWVNTHK
jgi:hypothetical protein